MHLVHGSYGSLSEHVVVGKAPDFRVVDSEDLGIHKVEQVEPGVGFELS